MNNGRKLHGFELLGVIMAWTYCTVGFLVGGAVTGGVMYGCHKYQDYKARSIEYNVTTNQTSTLMQDTRNSTNGLQYLIQKDGGN